MSLHYFVFLVMEDTRNQKNALKKSSLFSLSKSSYSFSRYECKSSREDVWHSARLREKIFQSNYCKNNRLKHIDINDWSQRCHSTQTMEVVFKAAHCKHNKPNFPKRSSVWYFSQEKHFCLEARIPNECLDNISLYSSFLV